MSAQNVNDAKNAHFVKEGRLIRDLATSNFSLENIKKITEINSKQDQNCCFLCLTFKITYIFCFGVVNTFHFVVKSTFMFTNFIVTFGCAS